MCRNRQMFLPGWTYVLCVHPKLNVCQKSLLTFLHYLLVLSFLRRDKITCFCGGVNSIALVLFVLIAKEFELLHFCNKFRVVFAKAISCTMSKEG